MHSYKSKPHSHLSPVLKKQIFIFYFYFFKTSWSSSSASLISHVNQSLLQPVTPARRLIDSSPPQSDVKMASIMEGPLSKWTNVMKGWQYRWFVLDYNAGLLSYYTVGSSHRFVFVDPLRRWTVEVATGCPPKACCLSGVGSLNWHTEASLFTDRFLRWPITTLIADRLANQMAVLFRHFRYCG